MISVASSQCSLSSRRTMVVTYTAHFCRCPSLFLHKVSVGRLLPKTVEAFKRTHHTFVPHCPRGLAHAIQGQLNFAYVALQQPTLDGKAEMYLRPNCPLRCGSGVSVVRYCENCNALNLLSASLIGLNCQARQEALESRAPGSATFVLGLRVFACCVQWSVSRRSEAYLSFRSCQAPRRCTVTCLHHLPH